MNITRYIPAGLVAFLTLAAFAAGGCEETVAPTDLVYVERMVVRGAISPAKPVDSIRFSRTLPLNMIYDSAAAELTDVTGSVDGGGRSYPLRHIGHGYYKAEGLIPVAGEVYTLRADWRGRKVSATTRVPIGGIVDSIVMKGVVPSFWEAAELDSIYRVEAFLRPSRGEVYGMSYEVTVEEPGGGTITNVVSFVYNSTLPKWDDTLSDGRLKVEAGQHAYIYYPPPFTDKLLLYSFDEPYYDFAQTYYRDSDQGPFSNGEESIRWNIQGDGIGLFIGVSVTEIPFKWD